MTQRSSIQDRAIFTPLSQITNSAEKRTTEIILSDRAAALARPLREEPLASEFVEVLTFTIGEDRFAIETRFVTEVIRNVSLTLLPGSTSSVVGVTNLRGEVLAVAVPETIFLKQGAGSRRASGRCVIVLGTGHAQLGLDVSEVIEVMSIAHQGILDPPRTASVVESGLVRGVTNDARIILDGNAILNDERFVVDDTA